MSIQRVDKFVSDIGIIGAPFDTAVSYRPGKTVMTFFLSLSRTEVEKIQAHYKSFRGKVWSSCHKSGFCSSNLLP